MPFNWSGSVDSHPVARTRDNVTCVTIGTFKIKELLSTGETIHFLIPQMFATCDPFRFTVSILLPGITLTQIDAVEDCDVLDYPLEVFGVIRITDH